MTEREGKGNKEKFNENDFFKVYLDFLKERERE